MPDPLFSLACQKLKQACLVAWARVEDDVGCGKEVRDAHPCLHGGEKSASHWTPSTSNALGLPIKGHLHNRSQPEIGRHTSELQSLMRRSYAVFCLKKKKPNQRTT